MIDFVKRGGNVSNDNHSEFLKIINPLTTFDETNLFSICHN